MLDKESYLAGVEDVILLLRDELSRIKDPALRRFLRDLIEQVEEQKRWMARRRLGLD